MRIHFEVAWLGPLLVMGLYGQENAPEITSPKPDFVLKGHEAYVGQIAWSPNGRFLASFARKNSVIFIWDPKTGNLTRKLEGHGAPIYQLPRHPTADLLLASSDDSEVVVWSVPEGKALVRCENTTKTLRCTSAAPCLLSFSPSWERK